MGRRSVSRRWILALLVTLSFELSAQTLHAQRDISAELKRAESLYYGANFRSALDLLLDLERLVGDDPEKTSERLNIELHLGLSYLGLDQIELAKSKFVEVCTLDANYALSSPEFPPKAVALFEDAKASCRQNSCPNLCSDVATLIDEGQLERAQDRLKAAGSRCACAVASTDAIVKKRFSRGKELYAQREFADAAKDFAAVIELDAENEVAREYLRLSHQQLELITQRAFSEWRAAFDSRQFQNAAAAYEKIRSLGIEPVAAQLATQVESEYRNAFSRLLNSWKSACAAGDRSKMETLRSEAITVGSGLELGTSTLLEMQQCNSQPCIQGDPALALLRLKSRINPQIDPSLRRYLSRVRVNIEIGHDGAVTVKQITNANPRLAEALKNALMQWEFYPAVIDNQPRCVETELPIGLIEK
jgi:hypothetical protein